MKKLVVEFIGTFFLTAAVVATGNPIAIGMMLGSMVYFGGHISGGHYNPAVTLSLLVRKKISFPDSIRYWVVQFLGACCGAATIYQTTGKLGPVAPTVPFLSALTLEILGTFAFISVVHAIAVSSKLAGNHVYGLVIGFALMTCAFLIGPYSGGALNPALALGINYMHQVYMSGNGMGNASLYLIGPLAGGFLAGICGCWLEE